MLLQKKKNVTALQATARPVSNFHKKQNRERERPPSSIPVPGERLAPGTGQQLGNDLARPQPVLLLPLPTCLVPRPHCSQGQGARQGPGGQLVEAEPLLPQALAWSVPTEVGLREVGEAGRNQWELFPGSSCLGFPVAGLAAGPLN